MLSSLAAALLRQASSGTGVGSRAPAVPSSATLGQTPAYAVPVSQTSVITTAIAKSVGLKSLTLDLRHIASEAFRALLRSSAACASLQHLHVVGGLTATHVRALAAFLASFKFVALFNVTIQPDAIDLAQAQTLVDAVLGNNDVRVFNLRIPTSATPEWTSHAVAWKGRLQRKLQQNWDAWHAKQRLLSKAAKSQHKNPNVLEARPLAPPHPQHFLPRPPSSSSAASALPPVQSSQINSATAAVPLAPLPQHPRGALHHPPHATFFRQKLHLGNSNKPSSTELPPPRVYSAARVVLGQEQFIAKAALAAAAPPSSTAAATAAAAAAATTALPPVKIFQKPSSANNTYDAPRFVSPRSPSNGVGDSASKQLLFRSRSSSAQDQQQPSSAASSCGNAHRDDDDDFFDEFEGPLVIPHTGHQRRPSPYLQRDADSVTTNSSSRTSQTSNNNDNNDKIEIEIDRPAPTHAALPAAGSFSTHLSSSHPNNSSSNNNNNNHHDRSTVFDVVSPASHDGDVPSEISPSLCGTTASPSPLNENHHQHRHQKSVSNSTKSTSTSRGASSVSTPLTVASPSPDQEDDNDPPPHPLRLDDGAQQHHNKFTDLKHSKKNRLVVVDDTDTDGDEPSPSPRMPPNLFGCGDEQHPPQREGAVSAPAPTSDKPPLAAKHPNPTSVVFPPPSQQPQEGRHRDVPPLPPGPPEVLQNPIVRGARLRALGAKISQMDALVLQFEAETTAVKTQMQQVIVSAKHDLVALQSPRDE